MGCLQSKTNQINSDEVCIMNHPDAHPDSRSNSAGSSKRQISATSKMSTDSGYADDRVNKNFSKNTIGIFSNDKRALPERQAERNILEELQREGFIGKNLTSKPQAISFEILAESDAEFANALRRPPPRLAKIEEHFKKRPPLTEDQIREKLRRVEERRQKLRDKKVQRYGGEMMQAGSSMADLPKIAEEEVKSKAEVAAENRAQRLREKLEKLERRKRHAEEVRQRKLLAIENGNENAAFSNEAN